MTEITFNANNERTENYKKKFDLFEIFGSLFLAAISVTSVLFLITAFAPNHYFWFKQTAVGFVVSFLLYSVALWLSKEKEIE